MSLVWVCFDIKEHKKLIGEIVFMKYSLSFWKDYEFPSYVLVDIWSDGKMSPVSHFYACLVHFFCHKAKRAWVFLLNICQQKKSPWCHMDVVKPMVFCYQNCSDLLWEKIVLVIEKNFEIRGWRPRICKICEITWTIYSNSERSEQFLVQECFFNLCLEVSHI